MQFSRHGILLSVLLIACSPSSSVPAGPEPEPVPEPWEKVDGEFEIEAISNVVNCNDWDPGHYYTHANLIRQDHDAEQRPTENTFDLRAEWDDIMSYSHWDLSRDRDGWFESEYDHPFNFFGAQTYIHRILEGSVDTESIAFNLKADWGGYDENDVWVSGCYHDSDYIGRRRYQPWDAKADTSGTIDRKWLVEATLLEVELPDAGDEGTELRRPSIVFPEDLNIRLADDTVSEGILRVPAPGFSVIALPDAPERGVHAFAKMQQAATKVSQPLTKNNGVVSTIVQNQDASVVDIRGLIFTFPNIIRNPDGSIGVLIIQSNGFIFKMTGMLNAQKFDLVLDWVWNDAFTGELLQRIKIGYKGKPRYLAHTDSARARGEYNARFELVTDTCDSGIPPRRKVVNVLPHGEGRAKLNLTGFYAEPVLDIPEEGGTFAFEFQRRKGYHYAYSVVGYLSDRSLSGLMTIDVSSLVDNQPGDPVCSATYLVSDGFKRFQNYEPPKVE